MSGSGTPREGPGLPPELRLDPGPHEGISGTLYWQFGDGVLVAIDDMSDADWREAAGL